MEDYDEETEDYQAEAEVDEELDEEEEEEEEVWLLYYFSFTLVTSLKVHISRVVTSTLGPPRKQAGVLNVINKHFQHTLPLPSFASPLKRQGYLDNNFYTHKKRKRKS